MFYPTYRSFHRQDRGSSIYNTYGNSTIPLVCFSNWMVLSSETLNITESQSMFEPAQLQDSNDIWIIWASRLIFFMQFGFTLIEAGSVRAPNLQSILFKNVCIQIIAFIHFQF